MRTLLILATFAAALECPGVAQGTATTYDCQFSGTFTSATTGTSQGNSSAGSATPCVSYRVTYTSTASISALSIQFETSPDNSTWTAVPNTACSSTINPPCLLDGANPSTTTGNQTFSVRAYGAFVRVNVTTFTGSGTLAYKVYGYKGLSAGASNGGSGGGGGGGSGMLPWYPASPATPPTLSNWTQVNGGGNGTFADIRNAVQIDSVSGNNIKALWLPAPGSSGTAFTITAHMNTTCFPNGTSPSLGIMIGDTGTKMVLYGVQGASGPAPTTQVQDWNSSTSFSSAPNSGDGLTAFMFDPWIRIIYDGTNLDYQLASANGSDAAAFFQTFTNLANSFLATAPAKIGIYVTSQTSGKHCIAALNYWNVTTP